MLLADVQHTDPISVAKILRVMSFKKVAAPGLENRD
jgi:hypothetical protein